MQLQFTVLPQETYMFVGSRVPERQLAAWRSKEEEEEEEEEEEGWAGASTKVRWSACCQQPRSGRGAQMTRQDAQPAWHEEFPTRETN
ncbi:unnamed protein product [Boreogadus saida]